MELRLKQLEVLELEMKLAPLMEMILKLMGYG